MNNFILIKNKGSYMKALANFEDNLKIPSNSSVDTLLNGGFEKGTVTQIFGPPSSGKSNIALNLAVNVARNGKKVIYMDTEGGISIDRIKQVSSKDFTEVANNIMVLEPKTFQEQGENIGAVNLWLRKNHENTDLFIIDSAVALYRVDDMNSSRLNKELGKQMGILSKIARSYDVAVIVTNQIYNAFDDEGNNDIRAIGGMVLQYWSKVIIQLERGEETDQRIATLKRHRSIGEGRKVTFRITSTGIN